MVIPQRGKRILKNVERLALQICSGWPCAALCGEGMEERLFICFLYPHFLRQYWNLNKQSVWSQALLL